MIGSFASGANVSLVAKIATKNCAQSIESKIMDEFWCSECLNDYIDLLYMIGSFASGTNASFVAKNWNKKTTIDQIITSAQISDFEVSKWLYRSPLHDGITCKCATKSLLAKIRIKDLVISCWVYRLWNNGRILMFKVSKQPYRSPQHDRIICKWEENEKTFFR